MAKFFFDWAAAEVGNWLRGATPTPVSAPEVALFTTAPSAAGGDGVEVVGGSYAAQPAGLDAFTGPASDNGSPLSFPDMPACTVVAAVLRDGVSGQELVARTGLSVVVSAGQVLVVSAGELDVALIPA